MKRILEFKNSLIDWSDVDFVSTIIPEIKDCFQRHKYDFIYNNYKDIEINIEQLDKLSEEYSIEINSMYIKINN